MLSGYKYIFSKVYTTFMGSKFNYLQTPKRSCRTCNYEWFLRAVVERNNVGKIIGVETVEPKNCPNPRCKSPYWNKPYVLGVKA